MNLIELRTADVKDDGIVQFIEQLYAGASNYNLKKHQDWYLNERFARGDHWVAYNKTEGKIMPLPTKKGTVRRTINKIRTQIRGVKNFIKRSQPRWEAHPNDSSDEAFEKARKMNKILQNFYRTKDFKTIMTDVITNSMKTSVGLIEASVVDKKGKIDVDFWVNDTFDVAFDPTASTIQDSRFYIKTKAMPLTSIKEKWDVDVKADNKASASQYKELLENERHNGENAGAKDLETAIVKETWIKWLEDDEVKMRKITTSNKVVLEIEEMYYRQYPMWSYCAERESGVMYPDSWIKDLISPNKSLDKTISAMESHIQQMLSGKWMIKKGVDVSTITDNGAEKIYYNGSVPPTQMNLQPLPSSVEAYANKLEGYIEEFGGIREASLGRNPGSLQSGVALEALQSADAGVVAEPIENMEILLQKMGGFILEVIADFQVSSQTITEGREDIKYIGNVENAPEDSVVVTPSDIKVVIVPEIAYTEDAKLARLMQLAEGGLIDPETVLEKLNFSNVADVMERVKYNKEQEYQQSMMTQRESHRTDGGGVQDTAQLANQENTNLLAGNDVPMTPQALWVKEHTDLHLLFFQENREAFENNPEAMAKFQAHLANEENYQ